MATFWSADYSENVTNPKRAFRFKITINAFGDANNVGSDLNTNVVFWAKTADKPSFSLGEASHNFLNHTFKFPGRVTWNDVTITMVDPGGEKGVAFALTKILNNSGYVIPAKAGDDFVTISKSKAVSGLGQVLCEQLDDDGGVLESWTLNNSFIADVNFGNLDYSSDELTEYSLTIRYDWATYNDSLGSEVDYKSSAS